MRAFLYLILLLLWRAGISQNSVDTVYSEQNDTYSILYKTNGILTKEIAFYEPGNKRWESEFKNGLKHGMHYDYSSYDSSYRAYPFENGLLNGIAYAKNHRGQLIWEITYKNGVKEGKSVTYNSRGKTQLLSHYKNGKLHGEYKNFSEKGVVVSKGNYVDGLRTGVWTYYYKSGEKKQELICVNDTVDGPSAEYYKNGKTLSTYTIKKGHISGEVKFFNKDGNPADGMLTIYSENGTIEREVFCKNGKPEGPSKYYFNGMLRAISNYENGLKHGPTFEYDQQGNLIKTEYFRNGEFETKKKFPVKK